MNDRDVDALIQDVLDGDDSPERLARLREVLARDPSARARREEQESLFARLRAVPLEDPPADLRDRVMAAVRARSGEARRHARAVRPGWGGLRLAIPLAAAAAGLAIVAAYFTWPPGAHFGDGVRGAMTPPSERAGGARMFTDELRAGGITARLGVVHEGDRLRLDVEAPEAAGAEVAILYPAGEFRAQATGFRAGGPGRWVLTLGPARVRGGVVLVPIGTPRGPVRVRLTTPAGMAQTEIDVDPASPGP